MLIVLLGSIVKSRRIPKPKEQKVQENRGIEGFGITQKTTLKIAVSDKRHKTTIAAGQKTKDCDTIINAMKCCLVENLIFSSNWLHPKKV